MGTCGEQFGGQCRHSLRGIRRDRQIPAPVTFPGAAPAGLTASSSTATHAQ